MRYDPFIAPSRPFQASSAIPDNYSKNTHGLTDLKVYLQRRHGPSGGKCPGVEALGTERATSEIHLCVTTGCVRTFSLEVIRVMRNRRSQHAPQRYHGPSPKR